jgi:hypothetical protein
MNIKKNFNELDSKKHKNDNYNLDHIQVRSVVDDIDF